MSVKDKLTFFAENGFSISVIAREIGVEPSTLNKWIKGTKGITHKNEEKVLIFLQNLTNKIVNIMEE